MNAHLINISDESYFINTCIPSGFLGVNITGSFISHQGKSKACKTSYSMYADMKTIRLGDIIFVHAGNKIYGAFKAESEFMEDNTVNLQFLSPNIHYKPNNAEPSFCWRDNFVNGVEPSDYRRIAISHYIDTIGNNISYKRGFESTKIFDLKIRGNIFSVPERWKYTDSARTVRPLMEFETFEILKLLEIENRDDTSRYNINQFNLANYNNIEFILNPTIIEDEKIIEGWICGKLGRTPALDLIFKQYTSFGNNIPLGYLKHADIIGYKLLPSGTRIFRIIEVKLSENISSDNINQLIDYMNICEKFILKNDLEIVEGYYLAKSFTTKCVDFVNQFNKTGRKIKLIQYQYNPPAYQDLIITSII